MDSLPTVEVYILVEAYFQLKYTVGSFLLLRMFTASGNSFLKDMLTA